MLCEWLDKGYYGSMYFMESYGMKCVCFDELVSGMFRVISVCMNYLLLDVLFVLYFNDFDIGYISCYVFG